MLQTVRNAEIFSCLSRRELSREGGPFRLQAMRLVRCFVLSVVLFAIAAVVDLARCDPATASENRVALLVGNSNYKNAPRLSTPVNDAEDIATALSSLGFDVILRKNTSIEDLRLALLTFSEKSAKADISIVYFAGYSVSAGLDGYLIPVDAELTAASSFRSEAIPLRVAMLGVARARSIGLLILDSLRGNPFAAKLESQQDNGELDAPSGRIDAFRNVLVFFATEPSKMAEESGGRNSPLAAALLKYLPAPDLEISFLFRNVRDEVRKSTAQKQTPYMYGQLSSEMIFLNAAPVAKQSLLAVPPADPSAVQPCDELAAAPEDTKRGSAVKGVKLENIKTGDALAACSDAAKKFPGVDRFHYQLGRAQFAAKDYPSALASYKRAFELGNTQALYALGAMYDYGTGVDRDSSRARFYYEIAAEMKYSPAIVSLGIQLERGVGAPKDLTKAYSFYQRAADLGDSRAINKMGVFAEKGLGVEKNAKQARGLYERSAAMGDDEAMVNLARCYANGIGGRKDVGEARLWLEKAALAGSTEAKQILASLEKAQRK
jgi:TPR repeat protein